MRDGFIKVAAGTPKVKVADCVSNREALLKLINDMAERKAKIMVFPELCLTGYDCRDLFWQETLIRKAEENLLTLAEETADVDALIFVGLPLEKDGKLYNVTAALNRGHILGFVPKSYLPDHHEFCEARTFEQGSNDPDYVEVEGRQIPFGTALLFTCDDLPHLKVAAEIGSDLWALVPPSTEHVMAGATVIVNPTASDELVGRDEYRRRLVKTHSGTCLCGYICASAGEGESSTDLVFGGHNMIAENGHLLAEAERFKNETIYADIDVERLLGERRANTLFPAVENDLYRSIPFELKIEETPLERAVDPAPFIPDDPAVLGPRCAEILKIQSMGLKKRMEHINSKAAVIGISGGLDSTLALIVTALTFDELGLPREGITAVTMPSFGTTDRTYTNACEMIRLIGATFREVNIEKAVRQHFRDIAHDVKDHNVTFENAQARERTQVLMDIGNDLNALVVGTGDLSELALGWATYNGDHMSMYAVNGSVPKTLIRHVVRYYANTCGDDKLKAVLLDVLDTPVSPELLPPDKQGKIAQKTEDIVGPYKLHDFFLYQIVRYGYPPAKVFRLAKIAFAGQYDDKTLYKWLRNFYWRFFAQQFKRSCLPDGPKVGSVGVSPRGDLRMPSDASCRVWLDEMDKIAAEL